jgi:hypothetical protein
MYDCQLHPLCDCVAVCRSSSGILRQQTGVQVSYTEGDHSVESVMSQTLSDL